MWVFVAASLVLFACRASAQGEPGKQETGRRNITPVTKENPWQNSLGMKFVPVPGTKVLFSIWDTRVEDFEKFVNETNYDATAGMYSVGKDGWKQNGATWKSPGFTQGPASPVVGVNWEDAKAFCVWLTKKERKEGRIGPDQEYRLPKDEEWSAAAGDRKYPWGSQWPPPDGAGNYAGSEAKDDHWPDYFGTIDGYRDAYPRTSPVGSFGANEQGLFDLSGNVWQWCEDWYRSSMNSSEVLEKIPSLNEDGGGNKFHLLRGASWNDDRPGVLLSSCRSRVAGDARYSRNGFRCVFAINK